MLPASQKRGARLADRVASIVSITEPILGVDRAAGERAWIRQQPHGQLFITRDPADTIITPRDHPLSGQPRYRWKSSPKGPSGAISWKTWRRRPQVPSIQFLVEHLVPGIANVALRPRSVVWRLTR